jgi:FlaA1/EpsC-like NDP-sugar epimerase
MVDQMRPRAKNENTPGSAFPTPSQAPARQPVVQRPEKKSFFVDKVVMITGASSGIGRTLAFWYLNNGARVVLVGRDFDELQEIGE